MKDQTDTSPDTPPDALPPAVAVTSTFPPPGEDRYPDRFRGPRWSRGGTDDESTWEQHQDNGTFPAWV